MPRPIGPYAAALWDAGSRINAIGAGPDSDELTESELCYVRALEDVMLMIKVLQLTSCSMCGGLLEATAMNAGSGLCNQCSATTPNVRWANFCGGRA
jgi:hypothetical protein